MRRLSLEERVAALEQRMAHVQSGDASGAASNEWRGAVGMFTGDNVMKQIDKAARKLREGDRRRTRRLSTSKARRTK